MNEPCWSQNEVAAYLRAWAPKVGLKLSHVQLAGNDLSAWFCSPAGEIRGWVGVNVEPFMDAESYGMAGFLLGLAIHKLTSDGDAPYRNLQASGATSDPY